METTPRSILIVGSGVFGLSTAWALTKRPQFASTAITVVDDGAGRFPAADSASVDSSRIIRADYADPHYAALAAAAQEEWRKQGDDDLGGQGRYSETGLVVTAAQSSADTAKGKKSDIEYTKESWRNVVELAQQAGRSLDKIRVFGSAQALRDGLGVRDAGDWGYINGHSGWANNEASMQWLYERVRATGRVRFVDAKVKQLATEGRRVTGAELADGTVVKADVVFVAAGAWTGELVDLRGRVEATGQAVGYIDLTDEECKAMENGPVILNLNNGLFFIPPRDRVLKVARHGYGYLNPVTVTTALPPTATEPRGRPIVVSRPYTSRDGPLPSLPAEADRDLRRALRELVPVRGLEGRPWKETRLCWYADTADAEWLVDWHPGWDGLFVATGDSGHGFKFLPIMGEKFVDCMVGRGGELGDKWRWREELADPVSGRETDGVYRGIATEDGSRGGPQGMTLEAELAKLSKSKL